MNFMSTAEAHFFYLVSNWEDGEGKQDKCREAARRGLLFTCSIGNALTDLHEICCVTGAAYGCKTICLFLSKSTASQLRCGRRASG